MAVNINLNDGYKEFTINNDPDRVIRFNPSDTGLIDRIEKAYQNILNIINGEQNNEEKELPEDDIEQLTLLAGAIRQSDNIIRDQIDLIFNAPVSGVVFGNQSPLSTVGGIPLYERFLNAILPEMVKEFSKEQKASMKRIEKYVKAVKQLPLK